MIQRIDVAIDCRDLATMSKFWTVLLGYREPAAMDHTYLSADHPSGRGPRLVFQQVSDVANAKSTFHLDIHVDEPEQFVHRVIELGGARVDEEFLQEAGSSWVRCLDPEGNVLCIVTARESSTIQS
jgi:catechol 2,3-dioxygenase-like lactoylglutathione lyase family enzyme